MDVKVRTVDGEVVSGVPVTPVFRTPYNYDSDAVSVETGLTCKDESLADQSQRDEADINTIVKRFGLTGQLPSNLRMPQYGDFENALDFRESMEAVAKARESFMEMPADVRAKFHNDPQEFLEYCEERNDKGERVHLEELRKLGLAVPEEVVVESAPLKVHVVNPEVKE